MAAILQFRRGSTVNGLTLSEPFFDSSNETLNIGTDDTGGFITIPKLNSQNTGNFSITGDITSNNGIFAGDVNIDGNIYIGGMIYLGDSPATDIINVNASFSGSLVPSSTSTFDIGSPTRYWKHIYTDTITAGTINGTVNVTFAEITDKPTLVSGSTQIDHNLASNYVANQHIPHNTLNINAGLGLSGGGTLTSSKTLTLDTTSVHFTNGVKTKLNTENVVSGSAQLNGSTITNVNLSSPTVQNGIRIDTSLISYTENIDVDSTTTEVIATVPISTYDGAFFDYIIKRGSNLRIGTVMAVHDGATVSYTDNSTTDLGNTNEVVLSADILSGNLRLLSDVITDNWTIKTMVRAL